MPATVWLRCVIIMGKLKKKNVQTHFCCLFLQPHLNILYCLTWVEKNMGGEVNFVNIKTSSTIVKWIDKVEKLIACWLLALEWTITFTIRKMSASFIGV